MNTSTNSNVRAHTKALVVVSFGTTYPEARRAIVHLEQAVQQAFPGYDFYRAFTSNMVIDKIRRTEHINILTPAALMQQLAEQGYEEVRCQSLHVIFGQEYEKMCAQLAPYRTQFEHLWIGSPLLWDTEDYLRVVRGVYETMPVLSAEEAYVFMGHGTEHRANAAYALVENTFRFIGAERVYVGTVEGFPGLDYVLARLRRQTSQLTHVHLAPFMIVAGDHAQNDLAGDWKAAFEREGYTVETHLQGLGDLPCIGELFADHCRTAQ